jgi:hypothetical protein
VSCFGGDCALGRCAGGGRWTRESSKSNRAEAEAVARAVFLEAGVKQHELGIVTPYAVAVIIKIIIWIISKESRGSFDSASSLIREKQRSSIGAGRWLCKRLARTERTITGKAP